MKWKTISHTADYALRIYGKDFNELLHNAFTALLESLFGKFSEEEIGKYKFKLKIAYSEEAVMIIDFLREILYQIVAEKKIPRNMKILRNDRSGLEIEVFYLNEIEPIPKLVEIKAVTYHDIKIVNSGSELFLDIICDV